MAGYFLVFLFLYYDYQSIQKAKGQKTVMRSGSYLTFGKLPVCWFICFFVLVVVVLSYKLAFLNSSGILVEPVYNDYVFYAKLSKYLLETGIENSNLDYIFATGAISPYHYTDIWINSLLVYLTQKNAVVLMILSSYSIGLVMVWMGFMAIWEQYSSRYLLGGFVSVLLLFFSGLYWGVFSDTPFWEATSTFSMHTVNYAKLFPLFVAVILLILVVKKNQEYLISALLIFPIINISTLPGVGFVILCILLYRLMKDKSLDITSLAKATVFVSFVAAIYLLFGGGESEGFLSLQFDGKYFKTAINVIGGSFVQLAIMYLPILIILVLQWRHIADKVGYTSSLIMIFLCFAFPWALLHRSPNSVQLFSNFFVPFATCISVDFCLRQVKSSTGFKKVAIVILFLSLPIASLVRDISDRVNINRHSPDIEGQIAQIRNFFDSVENPLGVYFRDNYSWASKNPVFGALDMKLQQFVKRPGFHTVSLSVFEIPLDSSSLYYKYETGIIEQSTFVKYIKSTLIGPQKKLSDQEAVQLQIQFIRDHKVSYILKNYKFELPDDFSALTNHVFDSYELNIKVYEVNLDYFGYGEQ